MHTQTFVKKFKDPERAQNEFERASGICEAIKANSYVRTPKPLQITGDKVSFEAIPNAVSLQKLTNRMLTPAKLTHYFYLSGEALAAFHEALNPGADMVKDKIKLQKLQRILV